LLEALFQETRAYYGDEDATVVAVRTEIAKVFLTDENLVDALNELHEIRKPDFVHLKMILECQMKVSGCLVIVLKIIIIIYCFNAACWIWGRLVLF
jgi:hypothetical protein